MSASSTTGSRVVPCLAVLATVATVALLVTIPAWHLGKKQEDERRFLRTYRIPYDPEACLSVCGEYATTSTAANDVVFVGGSTCKLAIQTTQFERLTGLTAYNLGSRGMLGIEGFRALIQAYINHHPAPRMVVLCVHPNETGPLANSWGLENEDARWRGIVQRFLWSYGATGAYPRPSLPNAWKTYVTQGLLTMYGDLAGGEDHFLNKVSWAFNGRDYNGRSFNSLRDAVSQTKGFESTGTGAHPRSAEPGLEFGDAIEPPPDQEYSVASKFDEGVRAIAQDLALKEATLMIRLSPNSANCPLERFANISRWFDQLESDCPNLVCDRPETLSFGDEYLWDTNHCNHAGAERFTAIVASHVAESLSEASRRQKSRSGSESSGAERSLDGNRDSR